MIKRNIKMIVTPEESKQVQEICFAKGIVWGSGNRDIMFLDKPFLHISMGITYGNNDTSFESNSHEEVDASFFIRTQGTCVEETPKQELKQNINKEETMENNEVESYADVKEYLIAKGLYERVLEIDWDIGGEPTKFNELFFWGEVEEGYDFWNDLDDDLLKLRIKENIESLVQDYKVKQGKESIKHLEAQPDEAIETKPKPTSYADVKEYLIAKGLYERVLGLIEGTYQPNPKAFSDLFQWSKTPEGVKYWDNLDNDLIKLKINRRIESLVQDYKAKQCVEAQPTQKPKRYLCYVQGKALPKHIHKTLEQAKQEAQRLCRKELAKVSVLEVVAEYKAEVLVKEVM